MISCNYLRTALEVNPSLAVRGLETATAKVQAAENAWNTRDPDRVAMAYTEDSEWRNRSEFVTGTGRAAIRAFLSRKWAKEQDYRLRKELWCFMDNRIAVRFEYEWHDISGAWHRAYGNKNWEFAPNLRELYGGDVDGIRMGGGGSGLI